MSQKYNQNNNLPTHKQARPTTPVQKFGETNPMMPNQIFGPLDALYTKCALFTLLFRVKIYKVYTKA